MEALEKEKQNNNKPLKMIHPMWLAEEYDYLQFMGPLQKNIHCFRKLGYGEWRNLRLQEEGRHQPNSENTCKWKLPILIIKTEILQ